MPLFAPAGKVVSSFSIEGAVSSALEHIDQIHDRHKRLAAQNPRCFVISTVIIGIHFLIIPFYLVFVYIMCAGCKEQGPHKTLERSARKESEKRIPNSPVNKKETVV